MENNNIENDEEDEQIGIIGKIEEIFGKFFPIFSAIVRHPHPQ